MSAALSELLLLSLTATGAWIAAIFAVLTLRKGRASTNDLTKDGAAAILDRKLRLFARLFRIRRAGCDKNLESHFPDFRK